MAERDGAGQVDLQPDQLRAMAEAFPEEVAYRNLEEGTAITFGHWEREANRLAHGLRDRGIGKGDLVSLYLEAGHILDFVVAYTAVHRIGAIAVPMNNRLSPLEARDILEHAEVSTIVASGSLLAALGARIGELPSVRLVVSVRGDDEGPTGALDIESVKSSEDSPIQVPLAGSDLADVMYTSGTTGRPKGVAVRHANIALVPNTEPRWSGAGWLTATPVFTLAGLGFVYNPMKAGLTVLFLPKFDAGTWLDTVERERPVIAFIVPAMAQLIVHHPRFGSADLSSLVRVVLGSAPLSPPTLQRLQERLPNASVLNSYGMTEGGHATFSMDPEGARTHPGAVGRPRPSVEVRIVGDDGTDCATGTVGEVVTRFPDHREYYKDPEATARMWADGWLHTGDLGHLDADGYLYIVGRKKEMIVRGGMNVYADDVESALHAHPDVVEAAVVGVTHDVLGEDVAAFVVRAPGSHLDAEELQDFAGERLADYKVPRRITFVDALPRNAGGKVLKSELAGSAAGTAPSGPPG